MTDSELNASKLNEQVEGLADGADAVSRHAVVSDLENHGPLHFVASAVPNWERTPLSDELHRAASTRTAHEAVRDGESETLAYLTGLTEKETAADAVTVLARLQEQIRNHGAPLSLVVGGLPETGKTNTAFLVARIWMHDHPDGEIVTNARSLEIADHYVTGTEDLLRHLTRADVVDRPTLLLVDEGSTHFDARRHRREVNAQWSPLAKRFAKLSVDSCVIGHTLTDLHPEVLRLGTLFLFKGRKERAELYATLDPENREFADPVAAIDPVEKFPENWYDPDDWSPWNWDLDADVLALDDVAAIRDRLTGADH